MRRALKLILFEQHPKDQLSFAQQCTALTLYSSRFYIHPFFNQPNRRASIADL